MDGGGHGEQELHLVDHALDVPVEAQTEYLEEDLEVVECGKVYFQSPLVLEEVLAWLLVRGVLETDGADDECVGDSDDDNGDMIGTRVQDAVAPRRSHSRVLVPVHCDQFPRSFVSLQDLLRRHLLLDSLAVSPHLKDGNFRNMYCT